MGLEVKTAPVSRPVNTTQRTPIRSNSSGYAGKGKKGKGKGKGKDKDKGTPKPKDGGGES